MNRGEVKNKHMDNKNSNYVKRSKKMHERVKVFNNECMDDKKIR